MKSRGLEKTSTQMLTPFSSHVPSNPVFLSDSVLAIPLLLYPPFCCLSNLSPCPPLTPSLISPSPSTPSVSLITSPLPSPHSLPTPTHSWYSMDLSGQLYDSSTANGALPFTEGSTLRAAVHAVGYAAAVRLCVLAACEWK